TNQYEPGSPQRLALVAKPHVMDDDMAIWQVFQQVTDPYLLVQRPPHVRAEELRPASRVALGSQGTGGLGGKAGLGDQVPGEQLLPPAQQVPVPLVAVLRRLADDALNGCGERTPRESVALD